MKLVFIFGDAAVGKMTVGQELIKITDLRLFYNHMTIEPVLEIFGERNDPAIDRMRWVVLEEFAKTDLEGLIFTMMWDLDDPADWAYAAKAAKIFEDRGAEVYYVELVADQKVRLERNGSENRLKHKASKRNVKESNEWLVEVDTRRRFVSREEEIPFPHYIKIDNTNLPPEEVARQIKEYFGFPDATKEHLGRDQEWRETY